MVPRVRSIALVRGKQSNQLILDRNFRFLNKMIVRGQRTSYKKILYDLKLKQFLNWYIIQTLYH